MTSIKHFLISLLILALASFVSLVLTQQRLQIEAESIRNKQIQMQTPYQWEFDPATVDMISSYLPYWQQKQQQILAPKASNPKISLNFSGSTINSLHHQKLVISSQEKLHGYVTLEFQNQLSSDFYYYSPRIQLTGKSQTIDLQTTWRGQNKDKSQIIKAPWGTSKQKVSSLILHFENPWKELTIDSIALPYAKKEIKHQYHDVNCDGNVATKNKISLLGFNHFQLNQFCLFSSNYLWLNQQLTQNYPGSTLEIKQSPSSSYPFFSSTFWLNVALYVFLIIILAVILKIRSNFKKVVAKVEPWYKLLIKKILMHKLSPYHFAFSYSVILLPTLFVLMILAWFKLPTLATFNGIIGYFLWAVVQQFVLGYLLAERVFYQRIQHKLIASLLAGLVFSLLHAPSVTLMLATFVGGSCWALAWLWFKRFIPLALSHAALALMFYHVVPSQYLFSAKVLQWFWG